MSNDNAICNKEPNLLLRLDSSRNIQEIFNSRSLTFSCAANWIDYAIKLNDDITGDTTEAVFARLTYPISDYYIKRLVDENGKPMGDNLLETSVDNKNFCYLRYMPTILMPAICFYGIDVETMLGGKKNEKFIELDKYAYFMQRTPSESSILLIKDMQRFEKDLKYGVINAVTMSNSLSNAGFIRKFDAENPFISGGIKYAFNNYEEDFFENTPNAKPLFRKRNKFKWQSEFRIVVNDLHFKQIYKRSSYDYSKNLLRVHLSHLQEYSEVIPLNQFNGIYVKGVSTEQFLVSKYYKRMIFSN